MWAISSGVSGHDGFLGVWRFDHRYQPPAFQRLTTALFPTRSIAREHLGTVKHDMGGYPKARIERVVVSVRRV